MLGLAGISEYSHQPVITRLYHWSQAAWPGYKLNRVMQSKLYNWRTGNWKNSIYSSRARAPTLGDLSATKIRRRSVFKKSSEGAITDPRIMNLIWEFSNQSKCIKNCGHSRGFSQINVKLSVIFIALLTKTLIGIDL